VILTTYKTCNSETVYLVGQDATLRAVANRAATLVCETR
jgi:hypothetical protein